ncbi:MAG: hypothetical protein WD016_09015 [Balneolaceae bacterium]
MKNLKIIFSDKPVVLILALICVTACQHSTDQKEIVLEDILSVTPKQLKNFDHIEDLYYSYLGINSFPLQDGDFVLAVWDPSHLVIVDSSGTELKGKTSTGKGPGELQDVGRPVLNAGGTFNVFDQFQQKVVSFNSELEVINEYRPTAYPEYRAYRIYTGSSDNVLIEMNSSLSTGRVKRLVQYNTEEEKYGKFIELNSKPYAPILGGGMAVPFSDDQFIISNFKTGSVFLFDTSTNLIAEVNAALDTIRVINVNLPKQKLSQAEKDTLRKNLGEEDWKAVESYLPEYKATADKMIFGNEHFWLQSNLEDDYSLWFVLNMEGEIVKQVKLPKESYLTHVSEYNLGVRLDEVTFALYEPVEL